MLESSENPELYENPSLLKTIPPPLPEDRSTKKAQFRSHGADADNPPPSLSRMRLCPPTNTDNLMILRWKKNGILNLAM
ncbi:hypothetical protein CUMW_257030 [Citrus unshiu]|uniref:Uncharacterized protein n=1 Tax=Citrus unshiu TaxID=55188 RepID=A0A2H5QT95_CITUN|nr:hypothetical protein CUMW_257030 [Citrus unshiu]